MVLPTGTHPDPKNVFDDPTAYWTYITSPDDNSFEGQCFDRKEAGRVIGKGADIKTVREHITETVSAFANRNRMGGLLVIGVSKIGEVFGINHLTEDQKKDLTKINDLLVHHNAIVKFHPCTDTTGAGNQVCLIFVPYSERFICETLGSSPKAWERQGMKNTLLDANARERLRREKKIVDFELTYCCPYDPNELNRGVVAEFRKVFLSGATVEMNDEEMLYQAGALERDGNGYAFTYAGYLFFAANPQRRLSWAYIRLLRFDHPLQSNGQRAIHNFEKAFSGSLPEQIRAMRSFFRESGFFKVYQRRKPDGGFTDEHELPPIAIDEAIVNAVAHRDYAVQLPIECEHYKDAFLVINPGRLQQRDTDVPDRFTLQEIRLNHKPQNPKMLEWLKLMKENDGTAFVKAISEGTWQMQRQMTALGLPSPEFIVSPSQTKLTLVSNAPEREAAIQHELFAGQQPSPADYASTYFANLFELTIDTEEGSSSVQPETLRKNFITALKNALYAQDWFIDSSKFSRLIAHRRGQNIFLPPKVREVLGFYPAYVFQLREYWGKYYLCIDYKLEVKNLRNLKTLCDIFRVSDLVDLTATAHLKGWQKGRIVSADREFTRIFLFDYGREELIASDKVIPQLPKAMLDRLVAQANSTFDLPRAAKEHGLSLHPGAARIRAEKTTTIAEYLAQEVFPISLNGVRVTIDTQPTTLLSRYPNTDSLQVYTLPEPNVEFNRRQEAADIREGITKFGSYDNQPRTIELVPICTTDVRESMAALVETLKVGKYKYKGAERTFGTRLTYNSIITVPSTETIYSECERLIREHPEWVGNDALNRIFLVQTPDSGYSADDEQAPYYRIKRLLLEKGIPCQMMKGNTIRNPEWKDLNLVLNIIAKCGVTPWVLPDAIPDADFFIGLSYTENVRRDTERLMGYANVFNQYGRWQFYSANSETFLYSEKEAYFKTLVQQTLERLTLSETPSIYFHYSAKFSREDRAAILSAARSVRPKGTYSFVWINTDHNVRFYDRRAETDGSLSRGGYVTASRRQIFLSTTGNNPYRKALGTPAMLEINIWVDPPEGSPIAPPDLKSLAVQMLNLTKLNWSSTNAFCGEPITTYYAHHIAYLTAAFLRQSQSFKLHPVLEKTPWFI